MSDTGSGIPPHTKIVSVTDATHAVMSAQAAATSAKEQIKINGGVHDSDCVERLNLCVAQGNEYRPTPEQVNAAIDRGAAPDTEDDGLCARIECSADQLARAAHAAG